MQLEVGSQQFRMLLDCVLPVDAGIAQDASRL
jgi:hypothetical protein